MQAEFVHLRVHTEFSLVDSVVRIKPLMSMVKSQHMPAVAMTDQHNLFAMVKFYRAAMAQGIKPIFGSDLLVDNEADPNKPHRLLLLCQNHQGYLNLSRLISKAYTEGQRRGIPLVQKQWVMEYSEGLIALSAGVRGEIGQLLLSDHQAEAQRELESWLVVFPNRFYLELQRTGREGEEAYIRGAVALAHATGTPVVASNDVCFLNRDDFEAHEARVCIHDGRVLNDSRRPKNYSEQQYLKSPEEMRQLFADIPSALFNSVEIAKRCNVVLTLGKNYLPEFPIPDGMTIDEFFGQQAREGLQQRLEFLFDKSAPDFVAKEKEYFERLELELGVINTMGFPGYFLIVADFIKWAKDNDIPVGPGRGSGAGSLVAYALTITDLDPIEYDLLFERFLNPERVSMPDFDVDFCMENRDKVIDYVSRHYGREKVSQIITYGTMAAKAVVRDVGRVLGHPYGFVDKIAKLIPFEIGITLDKALEQEEMLRQRYQDEEEVKYLIDLARSLEGITRNAGKHAGGVVIAPSELTDFTPLYCEEGGGSLVTQFDKDDVEAVGLVKFDFLGLRTLTIIDWALKIINHEVLADSGDKIDIARIPLVDKTTFDLLKACQTTAVFQLESRGMKDLIKRLQPDSFEDIVALVALFRPGPLQSGMVDDFINRKHGRAKVEYPHPSLEPILKPTYGVILYQEQVMQIAQVLAGYSLGGADLLRRAMGKKKPEEMAMQREIFTQGSVERGVDEKLATSIFDLMEKFAGYGFNKSHSAAYALVSYQTAWLKAHYPAAFMAAVMSADMDNTEKVVGLIDECKAMKIKLRSPNVNASLYRFSVAGDMDLNYGLGAIKGVGEGAIQTIVEERTANGRYVDLFDFCQRVDLKKLNRRCLETLIKCGAMDELGENRATLSASLSTAVQVAEQALQNQNSGQNDLFGLTDNTQQDSVNDWQQRAEWEDKARLNYEKETLGFYLSGHPIDAYAEELKRFTSYTIAKLDGEKKQTVVIAGLLVGVRTVKTRRGDLMGIITLDDATGKLDITLFSDLFAEIREQLQKDQLFIVTGEVSVDDFSGGLRMTASEILDISSARQRFGKRLVLSMKSNGSDALKLQNLYDILAAHREGQCPVRIHYQLNGIRAYVDFSSDWRICPSDELLSGLDQLSGFDGIRVEY